MSYITAHLPDGDDGAYSAYMERSERYDAALEESVESHWQMAIDPLIAERLVNDSEVGSEIGPELLTLAAYAYTSGGKADADYIVERLVELFHRDIYRVAKSEVDHAF